MRPREVLLHNGGWVETVTVNIALSIRVWRTVLLVFVLFALLLDGCSSVRPVGPTDARPPSPAARVVVAHTDGQGVYLRRTPRLADRLKAWPEGTILTIRGPDREGDGLGWKSVSDPDGHIGYVPAQYVETLSDGPSLNEVDVLRRDVEHAAQGAMETAQSSNAVDKLRAVVSSARKLFTDLTAERGGDAPASPGNPRGLYVLFIQGINSASGSPSFEPLARRLSDAYGGRVSGIVFDYRGIGGYGPVDTFGDPTAAATLVSVYLRQEATRNRDVFIVGHSMGGVVAALAVARFTGFPDGSTARIAGVVTLDSPLRGVRSDMSPCFRDLPDLRIPITAVNQLRPESPTIHSIAEVVSRMRLPFLTVAAVEDCVVPWDRALLPGADTLVTLAGSEGQTYDFAGSHSLVLTSPKVLNYVVAWMQRRSN